MKGACSNRGPSAPNRRHRGQSLAELGLTLPLVLLMVLFGIDFGRVFLGWVELNNAVREAANFAALNPNAWGATPNVGAQTEYSRLLTSEATAMNCTLPSPVPTPTFPNGTGIGSPATVRVTCQFRLITPVIGSLIGNPLNVSASAAFPVRNGAIMGVPVSTSIPTSLPSSAPTPTAALCVVPNLVTVDTNQATAPWRGAGFQASSLIFDPLAGGKNGNYVIGHQTLTSGSSQLCSAAMTVSP